METNGSGTSARPVSHGLIDTISDDRHDERQTGAGRVHHGRADHHAHRAQIVRRARHQVAGARVLEVAQVHALQRREEVVAEVVLEVARSADDDAAHQEAEEPADDRQPEKRHGIDATLPSVSELCRSSMAYLMTHGPASVSALVTTTQAKPSRNDRRYLGQIPEEPALQRRGDPRLKGTRRPADRRSMQIRLLAARSALSAPLGSRRSAIQTCRSRASANNSTSSLA